MKTKRGPRLSPRATRRRRTFFAFVSPWLLGFVFLTLLPLIAGLLVSLTDYDGLNLSSLDFVGLKHYSVALSDSNVRHASGQTLIWTVLNLPLWIVLSFFLAILVNRKVRGIGIFRTIFYLPSVIPAVGLVWTWKVLLEQNFGLLNGFLSLFRPGTAVGWLSNQAIIGVTTMAVWNGLGSGMIIFLAGLQGMPQELVEAAKIDGANSFQVFWRITLPMMTPVLFYQIVVGLIGAFQQFVIPWLATTSGAVRTPPRSVYLYMVNIYRKIFGEARFAYGMAQLWVLIVVILALTLLVFWSQRYWVYSEVEA